MALPTKDSADGIQNGWHVAQVSEIKDYTNPNNGKRSLKFVFKITDGPSAGKTQWFFCQWGTPFGEGNIAKVLFATGLEESFRQKFAKNDSWFDRDVITAIFAKVQGKFLRINIRNQKNSDFKEIYQWATMQDKVDEPKKVEPAEDAPPWEGTDNPPVPAGGNLDW